MMKAYYNSYSLPRPRLHFNMDALVQTTLLPIAIMFVVNLFIIMRAMQHTPLQFLRGDLRKKKREKAVRLPAWSFLRRFRRRIILAVVLLYLLTKIIIEKNEGSISMTKILGYRNKEIASLYITSTTIVVILADLISVFTGTEFLSAYWNRMMMDYDGYFAFHMGTDGLVKSFVFILISYIIVMIIDYHRISKVPMGEALKAME